MGDNFGFEDVLLYRVFVVLIIFVCFGLMFYGVYVLGRVSLCDNMNGSLLENGDGVVVCVDVVSLDLCVDIDRGVVKNKGFVDFINFSFVNESMGGVLV